MAQKMTPAEFRAKVVEELIATERKYIEDLKCLEADIIRLENSQLLSKDDIYDIFSNTKDIAKSQTLFYVDLEEMAKKNKLGELFQNWSKKFSLYTPYCINHQKAGNKVIALRETLLKSGMELDPDINIPSYLIKPIQRICKYPLLIKELIKYTPDEDPEKDALREALSAMQKTTVFINELKRRRECMAMVSDLEKKIVNWKGCDLRCYGELKLDECLPLVIEEGKTEIFHFFLFEKLFMYCKETSKKKDASYQLMGKFVMRDTVVQVDVIPAKQKVVCQTLGIQMGLKLTRKDDASKSIIIGFEDEEQLDNWANGLKKVLERNRVSTVPVAQANMNTIDKNTLNRNFEKERQLAKLKAEKQEKERLEKERLEKERQAKERQDKQEMERKENERQEKERQDKERQDKERQDKEKQDKERQDKERQDKEEKERQEKDRLSKARESEIFRPVSVLSGSPKNSAFFTPSTQKKNPVSPFDTPQSNSPTTSGQFFVQKGSHHEPSKESRDSMAGSKRSQEIQEPNPIPSKDIPLNPDPSRSSIASNQSTGTSTRASNLDNLPPLKDFDLSRLSMDSLFPICAFCNEEIMQIHNLEVRGLHWHVDHFNCVYCNQNLVNQPFYMKDSSIYCQQHYQELFSPHCCACGKIILENYIEKGGEVWHPEHFCCAHCGIRLEGKPFVEHEGLPYCEKDFKELHAMKCFKCQKPVTSSAVNALGKTFHPECFGCTDCSTSLLGVPFYPFNELPYCEYHFHEKKGTLCNFCRKPLSGSYVDANNQKFHVECFLCKFCRSSLTSQPFFVSQKDNCLYCQNCIATH